MLVEVRNEAQARRLELDGFDRTGQKAVETDVAQIETLLDRNDVTIKKCALDRRNGEREAEIIDREIRQHDGKVRQERVTTSYNSDDFKVADHLLFRIGEDSLTVWRDFQAVLNGSYSLLRTTDEDFEAMKETALSDLEEQRQEIEERMEAVRETALTDVVDAE